MLAFFQDKRLEHPNIANGSEIPVRILVREGACRMIASLHVILLRCAEVGSSKNALADCATAAEPEPLALRLVPGSLRPAATES